jgi:prepilin peptidase CpaA
MSEPVQVAIIGLMAVTLIIATYTDIRNGKIYNWTTLPAILLGLSLNTLGQGWEGLLLSAGGAAVVMALFLLFGPLVGIGGGDVKLLMAVGAVLALPISVWALLYSAVIGGVMSVLVMAKHKAVLSTTRTMAGNLYMGFLTKSQTDLTSGSIKVKFRYSPAILMGTIIAIIIHWPH